MPYSCTSVLRVCPIYINASVISVLFPDAMSRTLGSGVPGTGTTNNVSPGYATTSATQYKHYQDLRRAYLYDHVPSKKSTQPTRQPLRG